MKYKTLKDFFKERKEGCDVCDSEIEQPYIYIEYYEDDNIKDSYDKFVNYIESNVEFKSYNPDSCVGEIVSVKFLDLLKRDLKIWIAFTNKKCREEYTFDSYEDEDDFIENALPYVLEQMLAGNFSETDYKYFMGLVEKEV